jgi:hypothetical protein
MASCRLIAGAGNPAVRWPPTSACAGLSQGQPNELLYLHCNARFANHENTFLEFMSILPDFAPDDAHAIRKTLGLASFPSMACDLHHIHKV